MPWKQSTPLARSRRSLFKAFGVTLGAIAATPVAPKPASAQLLCWLGFCSGGSTGTGGTSGGTVCFLRGTQVLTADGYRSVESLVVGDIIPGRFSGLAPVERITSFVLERTGPKNSWTGASRPVRVKVGALGEGMPHSELVITASHAIYADGMLVPVVNLVNGTSIVFEAAAGQETLQFFHFSLAKHDIVDVQGAPCETQRDAATEAPCLPIIGFHGGRDELRSRLRSAVSLVFDRRRPIDVIRDTTEERGIELYRMYH